jgi:hypothetical protein
MHLPNNNGSWKAFYMSPYKSNMQTMVSVHAYSTPKQGGHARWTQQLNAIYPSFFDNMSKVRSTMASILTAIQNKGGICISPRAVAIQQQSNVEALRCAFLNKNICPMKFLNQQVVYSLVPYTVGSHKDVTKHNCAKEFIECKACIRWPSKSGSTFRNMEFREFKQSY